jgi:hypothetical protein
MTNVDDLQRATAAREQVLASLTARERAMVWKRFSATIHQPRSKRP